MNTPLENKILETLSLIDVEEAYRDMLDDRYEEVRIGYLTFSPSRIVEELDPTAFRYGLSDYADSNSDSWFELDGEYYDWDKVKEIRNEIVRELEDEDYDLEQEIEDLTGEEEPDAEEINKLSKRRQEIFAEIKELESEI